jgi:hypothetical protein
MRFFGFAPPSKPESITDFTDIVADGERLSPSPTLYELEEMLVALSRHDPMNVMMTRMQLKWAAKAARKHLGIDYQHPYRKS